MKYSVERTKMVRR